MADPTLSPEVALRAIVGLVALQQAVDSDYRRVVTLLNMQLETTKALLERKEREHAEQLEKGRVENAMLFKDREKLTRELADAEHRIGTTSQARVDQHISWVVERLQLALSTSDGPQPHDAPDLREMVRTIINDLRAGRVLEPA